jgi:hypothetical protein
MPIDGFGVEAVAQYADNEKMSALVKKSPLHVWP